MRRPLLILGAAVGAALALVWAFGGLALLERWAIGAQREVQGAMAAALRAMRAGEPGALLGLLAVCFGYGFVHAAGPGHGKMLIGAYGMGSRVRLLPLSVIAVLSSLAQAATAVLVVYLGVALLGWTRERVLGLTEDVMLPLGYAAFVGIGGWMVFRGLRAWRGSAGQGHDGHAHRHDPDPHHVHDEHCGHRHGPTVEEVAAVTSWREAAVLIGGIALRPCSGALFVLILTLQMGIAAAGVLGAFAIGLGTASVTLAVAGMSVWAREGALQGLPGAGLLRFLPMVQVAAGAAIALVAAQLLVAMI